MVANQGSEMNSAFYTPVTTKGSPTEILANRFQGESYSDARNFDQTKLRSFVQAGARFSRT